MKEIPYFLGENEVEDFHILSVSMAMEDILNIHLLMVGNNAASLSMDYYYPREHLRKRI